MCVRESFLLRMYMFREIQFIMSHEYIYMQAIFKVLAIVILAD